MPKFFVHRYDVMRIKVAVEAENQAGALCAADAYLEHNHPIRNRYLVNPSVGASDEQIAEVEGYPTWLCAEEIGQEVTGYLVDVVGDEGYQQSRSYTPEHLPECQTPTKHDTCGVCLSCGRDNSGHLDEPCSDECPAYWEEAGFPPPDTPCLDTSFHDHEMDI